MAKVLGTVEIYNETEQLILDNIARALSGGNTGSREWQLEKLNELGALTRRNAEIIASRAQMSVKAVLDEIEQAGFNAVAAVEPDYLAAKKAGASLLDALPANADPALRAMVSTWQKNAVTQINLTNQTLLAGQSAIYQNTINQTTFQVLSGVSTPQQALAQTVRTWSKSGIPSIVNSAGNRLSTEAYVNLVMRSNIRAVTTNMQLERAVSYEVDLQEVSSHIDAREKCEPYQGKIYSMSGTHQKYPALDSTSKGEPDGLFGINCRHNMYPFFEGLSTPRYKGYNKKTVEASYANSQKQRLYERSIRQSKREVSVFENLGDDTAAAQARRTLNDRRAALRSFLKDTGRTRRSGRELIYNV